MIFFPSWCSLVVGGTRDPDGLCLAASRLGPGIALRSHATQVTQIGGIPAHWGGNASGSRAWECDRDACGATGPANTKGRASAHQHRVLPWMSRAAWVVAAYEMASEAVEEFIDAREGDAFGLTLFGSHQIRWTPLTTDLDAIRQALPFCQSTKPTHAHGWNHDWRCSGVLPRQHDSGSRSRRSHDRAGVPMVSAQTWQVPERRPNPGRCSRVPQITLYHVHVGSGAVPTSVADLARETGGEAFAATDRKGLERIFLHIDRMRPGSLCALVEPCRWTFFCLLQSSDLLHWVFMDSGFLV